MRATRVTECIFLLLVSYPQNIGCSQCKLAELMVQATLPQLRLHSANLRQTMKQIYCKHSIKEIFLQSYFIKLGNSKQVNSNIQATLRLQAYVQPLNVF